MRHRPARIVIPITAVILASTFVYANLDGPPPGHTGTPGEGTCADVGCHDVPTPCTDGRISFPVLRPPLNDTVEIVFNLRHLGCGSEGSLYGFQVTVSDSVGQPVGDLMVVDSARTQKTVDSSGRQYISHTSLGAIEDSVCLPCQIWTFAWVPGGAEALPFQFDIAGLIADGDGTADGDNTLLFTRNHPCPINVAGEVNVDGVLTTADIIVMVNYIFKGTGELLPCAANGDNNCSGAATSADIIYLLGHVFRGAPAPCDICNEPVSMYDLAGC